MASMTRFVPGERRRLTRDLYGVRGSYRGGQCIDHLTRGTEFTLDSNSDEQTCLFAYGREYPLDMGLLYDALKGSEVAK